MKKQFNLQHCDCKSHIKTWGRTEYSIEEFLELPLRKQKELYVNKTLPQEGYHHCVINDDKVMFSVVTSTIKLGNSGKFFKKTFVEYILLWRDSCKLVKTPNALSAVLSDIMENYNYSFLKSIESYANDNFSIPSIIKILNNRTVLKEVLCGKLTNLREVVKRYMVSSHNINFLGFKESLTFIEMTSRLGMSAVIIKEVMNKEGLSKLYVLKDGEHRYSRPINIFIDMCSQAFILGEKINPTWSEKRMIEEHTRMTRLLMQAEIESKPVVPLWPEELVNNLKEYNIDLINDERRSFLEGMDMEHCVYTNYWRVIESKKYVAVHVNMSEGGVTIGLNLRDNKLSFDQAFHRRDKRLSKEENEKELPKYLKIIGEVFRPYLHMQESTHVVDSEDIEYNVIEEEELPWF